MHKALGKSSSSRGVAPCVTTMRTAPAAPFARRHVLSRPTRTMAPPSLRVSASSEGAASGQPDQPKGPNMLTPILAVAAVGALGIAAMVASGTPLVTMKEALARSGFTAAFSLIFISEIGDKTFFIAALLAMKFGRFLSLAGTMAALSVMTCISVGIGYIFKNVPEALKTSAPIGEYLSVALLFYFGLSTLWNALRTPPAEAGKSASDEELEEAREEVDKLGKKTAPTNEQPMSQLAIFLEVTSLIFFAEWGDRSMLATVALGASQNPIGVALGAIAGHFVASSIAVAGGAVISKYISERAVSIIGGVLFLIFGAATVFGLF